MIFRATHFCMNYCIALIATFAIVAGIELLPGLDAGYYSLILLPLFVVSVIEGQHFARQRRARPRACQSCLASLQMSVMALLMAKGILVVAENLAPRAVSLIDLPQVDNPWVAVAVICGAAGVMLRLGFALGLAVELRGQRARAGLTDRMDEQVF